MPDPYVIERQFYLDRLGWTVDDTTYSLDDLQEAFFSKTPQKNISPKLDFLSAIAVDTKIAAERVTERANQGATYASIAEPIALTRITSSAVDTKIAAERVTERVNQNVTYVAKTSARVRSAVLMNGTDQAATLNAEIASLTVFGGGIIELPGGVAKIKCNSSIILADGVTLAGTGMSPSSGGSTAFDFTGLPVSSYAMRIINLSDVVLRDFYVSGWVAGGTSSVITTSGNNRRITIERVVVNAVTTGNGIEFGPTGYVIQSSIRGCTVVGPATGFYIGGACTSINLSNCYANVCTTSGYTLTGTYLTLTSCAADTNGLWGYLIQNAVSVALVGCGAENNGRVGFYVTNSKAITAVSCRTVNSNTLAGAYSGFMSVGDASDDITLIGCVDTTPNAASLYSVSYDSGTPPGVNFRMINCGGLVKGVYPGLVNRVKVGASAAQGAGLNVPHGAVPTTPVNGDMWTTTLGMFVQINGVIKTITLT